MRVPRHYLESSLKCYSDHKVEAKDKPEGSGIEEERLLLVKYIYPQNKVVVLKACPGVIKLDPALVFKYLTADGAVQFIHIEGEIPTVFVDFCTGWRICDGLTMFGGVIKEIFTHIT